MMPVQVSEAASDAATNTANDAVVVTDNTYITVNEVDISVAAPVAEKEFSWNASVSEVTKDYLTATVVGWTRYSDKKAMSKGDKAEANVIYMVTVDLVPTTDTSKIVTLSKSLSITVNGGTISSRETVFKAGTDNTEVERYRVTYVFSITNNTIKNVNISNITAPSAGVTFDTIGSCAGGGYIQSLTWTNIGQQQVDSTTADYNTQYMVVLEIVPNEENGYYKFDDEENLNVSINGSASVKQYNLNEKQTLLTVVCAFPKTSGPNLTGIEAPTVINLPHSTTVSGYANQYKDYVELYTDDPDTSKTYLAPVTWDYSSNGVTTAIDPVSGNTTYKVKGTVSLADAFLENTTETMDEDGNMRLPGTAVSVIRNSISTTTTTTLVVLGASTAQTPEISDANLVTINQYYDEDNDVYNISDYLTIQFDYNAADIYYTMTNDGSEPDTLTLSNYQTRGTKYETDASKAAGGTVGIQMAGKKGTVKTYRIKAVAVPTDGSGAISDNSEFTFRVSIRGDSISELVIADKGISIKGIDAPKMGSNLDTTAICTVTTGDKNLEVVDSTDLKKLPIVWTVGNETETNKQPSAKTIYTASVTITANTGYYFTSAIADKVDGSSIKYSENTSPKVTPSDDGSTLTISFTFPATEAATFKSITAPTKVSFENGISLEDIIENLPKTVTITTNDPGITTAPVTWSETLSGKNTYDPTLKTAQTFKIDGKVNVKNLDVTEPAESKLATTIEVTVAAEEVPIPVPDIEAGIYRSEQSIVLSTGSYDDAIKIYYTLDGKAPTNKSTEYTSPIKLSGAEGETVSWVIKAIAIRNGVASEVMTYNYEISIPKTSATVTFDANGGGGTMSPVVVAVYDVYTLPACTLNPPSGKCFSAWAIGSPTGEKREAGSIYAIPDDTVLYAVWEDVPAAGDKFTKGNAKYKVITSGEVNKKEGTVIYLGEVTPQENVKVPARVVYKDITFLVTAVSASAWKNNTTVTRIKIGENVTTIGNNAANGCTSLKTLSLGSAVTTIGKKAFFGCKALKSVTIPSGVIGIGAKAFQKCSKLKKLKILTTALTAENLGSKVFAGTASAINVIVPESVLEAYQSLLLEKGVGKKATIKK
jgi:hypothetical protein